MMTDDEITAIEARADKATAGPWIYVELASHPCFSAVQGTAADIRANTSRSPRCYSPYNDSKASQISSDFEFIAAAREVVPALCAEVRRLRAALSNIETAYDNHEYADDKLALAIRDMASEALGVSND